MSLVQLYIPTEVAHDTISELGVMGDFQFKDVSGYDWQHGSQTRG
jgi:V-type H+-transporting ATPase subunit a